jgi:hypothetical protein
MYKKNPTSYTPQLNAFFALMMAFAASCLLVMPNDLVVKLAAYGISPDHRAVYVMTWGTVIATPCLALVAYRSWRRR